MHLGGALRYGRQTVSFVHIIPNGSVLQLVQIVLSLAGLVAVVVVGAVLWLKKAVPPLIAVALPAVVALLGVVSHLQARRLTLEALAHTAADMQMPTAAMGVTIHDSALLTSGLLLAPLATVGGALAAGAAIRQEERSRRWGAIGAGVVVATGLLSVGTLAVAGTVEGALCQASSWLLPGAAASFALTATDRAGRLGAVVASCLFALAVPAGLALGLAAGELAAFELIAHVRMEEKAGLILSAAQTVGWGAALGTLPTLTAWILPLVAVSRVEDRRDRPTAVLSAALAGAGGLLVVSAGYPLSPLLVSP